MIRLWGGGQYETNKFFDPRNEKLASNYKGFFAQGLKRVKFFFH